MLVFFRAAPLLCGSSQARGRITAVAASLYHSHRNARSKMWLWPIHSSWQYWILNLLSKARDRTYVLMDTNQVHYCWAMTGTRECWFLNEPVLLGWFCINYIPSLSFFPLQKRGNYYHYSLFFEMCLLKVIRELRLHTFLPQGSWNLRSSPAVQHGKDLALSLRQLRLLLWCMFDSLAQEILHATGVARKKRKKKLVIISVN